MANRFSFNQPQQPVKTNQPLVDFQVPQTAQPTMPFSEKTEGKIDPAQAVLNPGGTFIEPALKKVGVPSAAAFGIGLGIDILTPGPGELGRVERVVKSATEVADTAFSKLLKALKEAGPARKELETLYTAERSARARVGTEILEKAAGEQTFKESLGALKGELVPKKPAFEPLRATDQASTVTKLAQPEIDELFKKVQQTPHLDFYEKISTSDGLSRILKGEIPPNSQLKLLEEVFGSDLISTVMSKRSIGQKMSDLAVDILNVPRSLITSFDMSAPLRQGVLFTTTKPRVAFSAAKEMFSQAFSPKNFDNWLNNLKNEPVYKLAKEAKLYIADPRKIAGGLAEKEERFMSNIAQRIPLIGAVTRASERAYTSFLNKMRIDVFKNISNKFIKDGLDPVTDKKVFEDLANFINNATGRGSLPQAVERGAAVWNNVFFSPRLIASRFNLLNPGWYLKQSAPVRREAVKSFAEFIGVGSTVLALAAAAGADVELDPRSTDFGKIRVGNTRWDIWGGFQQWVRVFSQISSGERKTAKGDVVELDKEKYPFESRLDVGARFFRGKLAPIPSLILELLDGQKLFGDEITLKGEALDNAIPLYLQDIKDAIKQIGPEALLTVGIPGFFGVGVQSYLEKNKVPKGNRFNF